MIMFWRLEDLRSIFLVVDKCGDDVCIPSFVTVCVVFCVRSTIVTTCRILN